MEKNTQRILVAASLAAAFFVGYTVGADKNKLASKDEILFQFDNKKFTLKDLSEPSREKLKHLERAQADKTFDVNFDFYRQRKRLIETEAVQQLVALEAKKSSKEVVEEKLFTISKPSEGEIRSLFEGNDPSAPIKEMEKIRPQLEAYLLEVGRRERFDNIVDDLVAQKRLTIYGARPHKHKVEINIQGFPALNPAASKTVVNFTDFFCAECDKYNVGLLELAGKYPDIKFVMIPFPYTKPQSAIAFARGMICADRLGKFSDYITQFFVSSEDNKTPTSLASAVKIPVTDFYGCYKKGEGVQELLSRAEGEARFAGVLKTPVSFYEGKMYEGLGSLDSLRKNISKAK